MVVGSPVKWWLYIIVSVTIFFKLEGYYFDNTKLYNDCFVDRFDSKTLKADPILSSTLLYGSYVLIIIISVLSGMKQRINFLKAAYMTVVNLSGYCMLVFMKEIMADPTCNGSKPNSVSGHYAFYIFHCLTLPSIWQHSNWPSIPDTEAEATRKQPFQSTFIYRGLRFFYIIFLASTAWTLYRTFVYGFHSMSQILNGILFGSLMHIACVLLIRHLDNPTPQQVAEARRRRPSLTPVAANIPLMSFGAFTILSFALSKIYSGSIPLAFWEVLVNVVCWARILWGPQ